MLLCRLSLLPRTSYRGPKEVCISKFKQNLKSCGKDTEYEKLQLAIYSGPAVGYTLLLMYNYDKNVVYITMSFVLTSINKPLTF